MENLKNQQIENIVLEFLTEKIEELYGKGCEIPAYILMNGEKYEINEAQILIGDKAKEENLDSIKELLKIFQIEKIKSEETKRIEFFVNGKKVSSKKNGNETQVNSDSEEVSPKYYLKNSTLKPKSRKEALAYYWKRKEAYLERLKERGLKRPRSFSQGSIPALIRQEENRERSLSCNF